MKNYVICMVVVSSLLMSSSPLGENNFGSNAVHASSSPGIVIENISGGFGLSITIRNEEDEEAKDVDWSIDIEGMVLFGAHRAGTISSIPPGSTELLKNRFICGFGEGNLTVSVENETRKASFYMLGPFILKCTMEKNRYDSIPDDAVKITPEHDVFPPVLHSDEWQTPVPMQGPINTAGAEDSAFIMPDGKTFFFFFTPDVDVPPEKQLIDGVTGIWWCRMDGTWSEPERIVLNNDVSLDGAEFVQGNTMWFASVRAGNYGEIDFYTAEYINGKWGNVKNAGEQLNSEYDVGELHITSDGQTMYCGDGWGDGGDIYVLHKTSDGWSEPVALPPPVNTQEYSEDQPFITEDGNEMWFTGQSRLGYPGPAIFRSLNVNGNWSEPEEIISSFAGEPTLDREGNIYFTHHFFDENMNMIEADIYVAYRK